MVIGLQLKCEAYCIQQLHICSAAYCFYSLVVVSYVFPNQCDSQCFPAVVGLSTGFEFFKNHCYSRMFSMISSGVLGWLLTSCDDNLFNGGIASSVISLEENCFHGLDPMVAFLLCDSYVDEYVVLSSSSLFWIDTKFSYVFLLCYILLVFLCQHHHRYRNSRKFL